MVKKSLEEKVKEAGPGKDDSPYYKVPPEDKDIREGKLEKVKSNGKKKGMTYETDAERMMRAEETTPKLRQEVYRKRGADQEKYRKALKKSGGRKEERKKFDLGDAGIFDSVAGRAISYDAMVDAGGSWSDNIAEADYHLLKNDQAARKKQMFRESKAGSKRSREAVNVASNILFSMVPFLGAYQNRKTVNYIKNNKGKHNVVFVHKGTSLSEGPKAKQGSDFRELGYHPYLVSGLEDIKAFFEAVGRKPGDLGDIVYLGHGEGAKAVRKDSNDPDIKKYGVKRAYQVAPDISADQKKGFAKRISDLFSPQDGRKDDGGKGSILHYNNHPKIDNYVISGLNDPVATPDKAIDPHARKHYLLKDGSATNYGTAGTNKKVNADLISLIKYHAKQKKATNAFLRSSAADGYERRKVA